MGGAGGLAWRISPANQDYRAVGVGSRTGDTMVGRSGATAVDGERWAASARQFQAKIKWLGIRSTPAYVGRPECKGVAERFIRMLKEDCIHLHDFETMRRPER